MESDGRGECTWAERGSLGESLLPWHCERTMVESRKSDMAELGHASVGSQDAVT